MTFVVRPGCHLCDEAEPVVRKLANRFGMDLDVVDMEQDDELVRLYAWRIPVVLGPDGEVLDEGIIEEKRLRKALKALRRGR